MRLQKRISDKLKESRRALSAELNCFSSCILTKLFLPIPACILAILSYMGLTLADTSVMYLRTSISTAQASVGHGDFELCQVPFPESLEETLGAHKMKRKHCVLICFARVSPTTMPNVE